MNERMKTKNHDQLDAHNSIFAAARCSDDHSVSKTTPFADISEKGALIFPTCPGVSLWSTPGYLLATLRVGKAAII
jgi:hypothetical protein